MSDTIGSLASLFVQERIAVPDISAVDAWVEAVAAALFIAGVSTVLLSSEARASAEAMEQEVNAFCRQAAAHASDWMNGVLQPKGIKAFFRKGTITWDFRETLLARLVAYFSLYLDLMAERNLSHNQARWAALSNGLALAAQSLAERGLMFGPQKFAWIDRVEAWCRDLAAELPAYAR